MNENQRHLFAISSLIAMAGGMNVEPYQRGYKPLPDSLRRAKVIGAMIRKGRKTIAQKQAFLRSTSRQKKVLWRHSPLNPNRISVE